MTKMERMARDWEYMNAAPGSIPGSLEYWEAGFRAARALAHGMAKTYMLERHPSIDELVDAFATLGDEPVDEKTG
jgi:hypothetical protein